MTIARTLMPLLLLAAAPLLAQKAGDALHSGNVPPPPTAEMREEMAERQVELDAIPDSVGSGPYPAIKEVARNLPDHTVYRPADLARIKPGSLGIVGWGNGGCYTDGASARLHLAELASHGYVVVAPGRIVTGPGQPARTPDDFGKISFSTTGDIMAGIEWALVENEREGSPLQGLIDPRKVAVAGHSCGGVQAIYLGRDPRVAAVIVHNSGMFPAGGPMMANMHMSKEWLTHLRTPVLYILGGPTDIAYPNGMDDFAKIDHVPVAVLNSDNGHEGSFWETNGGGAAQAAVNWLEWQLRGDEESAAKFTGKDCGYCSDPNWSYEAKRLKP